MAKFFCVFAMLMVLVATIYALPVDNSAVEVKDDLETAQQFFGGYGGYGGYGGGGFGGGYYPQFGYGGHHGGHHHHHGHSSESDEHYHG